MQLDQQSATSSFFGALAGKKLVRFQEYAALYPEATFIFVGDNGQARRPTICSEDRSRTWASVLLLVRGAAPHIATRI